MSDPNGPPRRRSSSVRRSEEGRRAHTESPVRSLRDDEKSTFRPRSSGHESVGVGPSNTMSPEEHERHWRNIDPSIHRGSHSTQGSASLPGYEAVRIPSYHTTASSGDRARELDEEARRLSEERNRRIGVGRHPEEIARHLQRGNTGMQDQRMAAPRPRPPPERIAATTPISREEAGHGPQHVLHPPPDPHAAVSGSSGGSSGSRRQRLRERASRMFRRTGGGSNDQQ